MTEQLPEDGDARELLADIQAEKAELIAEKKIKKEKPSEPISDDEIPFDIPDNWILVKLSEIAFVTKLAGFEYTKEIAPNLTKSGIPLFKGKNIQNGHTVYKFESYIPKEVSESLPRSQLTKPCLLTPYVGTIGNISIFDAHIPAHLGSNVGKIEPFNNKNENVNLNYLLYYMLSPFGIQQLGKHKKKNAQESTSIDAIRDCFVYLPPLAEQHRLVARVDELMAKIDELEKVENELNALHKAFPGDMKAALLQAAMQGKLTEQLPEDGNAEDLLKSIETEKAKLIAEKKIKKQKASEPISEEDAPLQIPSNWSWAYIGDIFSHNAGKALNAKNQVGSKHKYITTSNVYWDHFELDNLKEMYYTDEEVEKYSVKKGDLLVLEGGDIGRSAIWNLDVSYCIQNHLHCLRPYLASSTNVKYYYYLMMLYKQIGAVNGKGIAIQGLSANALHSIAVPVAPLAEQQRIVERLDKLLPLCDSLEEKL